MRKCIIIGFIPGLFIFAIGLFVLSLLILKLLWAWVIPDIFPGAVATGLVAGKISWYTSLKLAILITIIGGIIGYKKS
uniref:Uncharacterized protein n=1 Tax=candidate division WOR-3 bacterium TaxID=2052148 RepID=A0A7C4YF54_UNCW3